MATYDSNRHHRRSIRLPGWDYTQAGAYFVTLCTFQAECLFGQVVNGAIALNEYGQIVEEEWNNTGQLRPYVTLDTHVVMPNHFHAIIWIAEDDAGRGTPKASIVTARRAPTMARRAPTQRQFGQPLARSLPTIIGAFKSAVTRRINQQRGTPGDQVWQRNYYEHIVRSERALDAIQRYIVDNPARWELDRYNAGATGPDPQAAALWQLLQMDR
jgi:putative transposase